jgi:saccharopine dehydrogenase (NAD+, L-lysine-forming)
MTRKRIKNGEYYTLISTMLFVRVAFFMLIDGVMNALAGMEEYELSFGNFTLLRITDPADFSELLMVVFYDLGIADFLLIELLAVIIIGLHFRGGERLLKTLAISGTTLFAVVVSRLLMVVIYKPGGIERGTLYMSVVRVFEPLFVYIIPIGIIVALIFLVNLKKTGIFIKNSLLKPTSVIFFIACFIAIGVYVTVSVNWIYRLENYNFIAGNMDDFFELLRFGERLKIAFYAVNSVFICGIALCFYRGAKLTDRTIKLKYKMKGNRKNMNGRLLIIGAGGVASAAFAKCCQNSKVFREIMLASRTKSKCDALVAKWESKTDAKLFTEQVDADNTEELITLIEKFKPDAVLNLALPYQDLTIMDACLATKTHYIDTANYEPLDTAKFEYKWQWDYKERYKEAGITALLGSGFDPGVTGVFCAYAMKHYFDEIHYIDILDCNGGDHGYPFATNFNPEINIREVSANGRYWEKNNGSGSDWIETKPMEIKREYDFKEVGKKDMYLLYHEELESLAKNIKGLKRIRFFMTFGQSYLTHLQCLENVGMTSIKPIEYEGRQIVPIQFLKAVLPDPASLGPRTKGKTNIGCIMQGVKDGKPLNYYVYNICDHEECYAEVGTQAISYTTGVPAMIGAMLVMNGEWQKPGVFNTEEFDPDPFMDALNKWGLPWKECFEPVLVE